MRRKQCSGITCSGVRDDAKLRLKKIAGQVTGVANMLDQDHNCVDILTQVASIRSALQSLALLVASAHVEGGIYEGAQDESIRRERVEEVRETLRRVVC